MLTEKQLDDFILKLLWFDKTKRTLEDGKKYVFSGKGLRFIHIRNYHEFHKKSFFRVRSLSPDEDPSIISTFSYPPKKCNRIGRANLKSKQVLYAAEDPTTAMFEYLNTGNAGNYIYLAEWSLKYKIHIPTFNIMEFPWDETEFYQKWTGANQKVMKKVQQLYSLIQNLFRKSNQYEFSAPWSHLLLYKSEICKMIRYPSVATKEISTCNAINIDFFDEHFYLKRIFKLKLEAAIDAGELEFTNEPVVLTSHVMAGRINEGKIVYVELEDHDKKFWNYYHKKVDNEGDLSFISDEYPN
jgi:hypothetical protein